MTDVDISTRFAETRFGRIHVREAGNGAPLVLLHATPKSSRSFKALMQHLAAHHHVIAPDTLGFGESDPLPPDVSINVLADSMADTLDVLTAAPAAVFGLHTGNKIGAALAHRHPSKVSHFILCGMTHSIIPDQAAREAAIKTLVGTPFTRQDISNDERRDRAQGAGSVDAIYAANYGFDLSASLGELKVPSLVLELATPEEDHFGRQAAAVAAMIPKGQAATFEGSDRDALDQRPDDLAEIILKFTTGEPSDST